ncbi:hypothetical protein HPB47_018451 [Ixodes persulcatus]|uniref:Uncharacterized protein n=1 Tax=Ixodes persulcatus TaxID=34615 RepID=A0AC60QKP5_IXOPE|nr:hypothetical protein HPB47_018451 [Ixodes persulcatus]
MYIRGSAWRTGTIALACLWSSFYGSPYATDGILLSLARHHLDAPVLMSGLLSTTEGSSTYNPSTMPLDKLPPRLSSPVSLPPSQEATASTPSSLERRLCDKRLREICICFTGLGGTPAMGFAHHRRMFFVQTIALACLWSSFYGSPYATDGSLLSLARHHLDAPVLMSGLFTTEGSSTYNPSTMPLDKLPPRLSSPVSLPPSQEATASTPSSLERRLCDKRLREICICFTGLGGTPAMGFGHHRRMFFVQSWARPLRGLIGGHGPFGWVANPCDTVAQRLVLAEHRPQGREPRHQVPVPSYMGYEDRKSVADFLVELASYTSSLLEHSVSQLRLRRETSGEISKTNLFHLGTSLEFNENWSAGLSTRTRP